MKHEKNGALVVWGHRTGGQEVTRGGADPGGGAGRGYPRGECRVDVPSASPVGVLPYHPSDPSLSLPQM